MTQKLLIEGKKLDLDIVLLVLCSTAPDAMKRWKPDRSEKMVYV
jgi:hypothetical protein